MNVATYRLSRGNEVKGIFRLEVHADGTLWSVGKPSIPVIDGSAPESLAIGTTKIAELCRAGKFNEIPSACFAHIGLNPSGLVVENFDDIRKIEMANIEANLAPAQRERQRINELFYKASKRENAPDGDNIVDAIKLRREARDALAKWRIDYPDEAILEKADDLDEKAAEQEQHAKGALTYDCDGSFTAEYQQKRHDEFMAKAADYRAEAAKLRETL